ncbi:MAG: AraC family transcriptional regulator [Spirochaetia bacterium]|nr:AraC family transcriptional regulator [Spirochaetia bacterium]
MDTHKDTLPVITKLSAIEKELPYTLNGAAVNYEQKKIDRPFGFPVFQFIVTQKNSGKGILLLDGAKIQIQENQVIILFPDTPHAYYPENAKKPWIVNWISFQGFQLTSLLRKMNIQNSGVYFLSKPKLMNSKINESKTLLSNPTIENKLTGSSLVYSLILDSYHMLHNYTPRKKEIPKSVLDPAIYIIINEYSRPITLDELANSCNLSKQHFIRLFKKSFSEKPTEFINRIRIEKSKELMNSFPDMKIGEVSRLCGFKNESYYALVFKSLEQNTPRQFRDGKISSE